MKYGCAGCLGILTGLVVIGPVLGRFSDKPENTANTASTEAKPAASAPAPAPPPVLSPHEQRLAELKKARYSAWFAGTSEINTMSRFLKDLVKLKQKDPLDFDAFDFSPAEQREYLLNEFDKSKKRSDDFFEQVKRLDAAIAEEEQHPIGEAAPAAEPEVKEEQQQPSSEQKAAPEPQVVPEN